MAYMHKMLKPNNNISVSWIKNIFNNYVYSQQPSYLMEFKCNFKLYTGLHFQTYGILTIVTSECAWVSDFSPHDIFAVKWQRICDLTVTMIDKTSSGFNLCHLKQGCAVGGKIHDSDLSKFPTPIP